MKESLRQPTSEEIEEIRRAFEKAADPMNARSIMPCPAIDMNKYQRQQAIERASYMGSSGEDHFRQYMGGLFRLVTYRAEVAKQLKKAGGDFEFKALEELFDYCNNQIKEYIAIP